MKISLLEYNRRVVGLRFLKRLAFSRILVPLFFSPFFIALFVFPQNPPPRILPDRLPRDLPANPPALLQELPIPSPSNTSIISIEHDPLDGPEIDFIRNTFNFGLYAWPSVSITALSPLLDWHAPLAPADADAGIQAFKDQVNALLAAAQTKNIRLHLVLVAGLCRNPSIYEEAMKEDVRNCQWYNDNKIAGDDEVNLPDAFKVHIFGTLSRYARKIRANLEAKGRAALTFLSRLITDNPDDLVAVSGWGESELNYHRINDLQSVQDYFCDYSPFAVLEFQDWIRHTGEYDDTSGKYKGQGYSKGGARFQGSDGLSHFNADFGTAFTTWDLRYFNWSLTDDSDSNPVDAANNDPHRLPVSSYTHGAMMPTSGPSFTPGGFDPPRAMAPGNAWWDLWNLFRETMVANYVRDAAVWASEAGIAPDRWFSHQIPADYLFGTNPKTPQKNARYYSSASPLWTADIRPYGSPGATIYDVKFPDWTARTTDTALPAMAAISPLWAIMEYDPETYPPGLNVPQSPPDFILGQYLRVYAAGPYFLNFWRWIDASGEHQIKGTNKEIALRNFVQTIRDKARSKDLNAVFTPPQVVGFRGEFQTAAAPPAAELRLTGKIWDGRPWEWREWGDFSRFEIYKGSIPGFPADPAHLLGTTRDYIFRDASATPGQTVYYKIRAVNAQNAPGPFSREIKLPGFGLDLAAGTGGTTSPPPGTSMYEPGAVATIQAIPNDQYQFSHWSGDASGTDNPLSLTMGSSRSIKANFIRAAAFPPLSFAGTKFVNRSLSQEEIIIKLTWRADQRNSNLAGFRIYLVEGDTKRRLVQLDPAATEYSPRGFARDKTYVFGITSVTAAGLESGLATATVK